MVMEREVGCSICKSKIRRAKSKKVLGKVFCQKCYSKKRLKRREKLKEMSGRRKRKSKELRKVRRLPVIRTEKVEVVKPPKIRGEKLKEKLNTDLYLRKDEKYILYKKFTSHGLSARESNERIKEIVEYLGEIVAELRKKNKPKEEIVNRFREEFARMCEDGR